MSKILESVIANRISFLVEKYQLLPKSHIGRRKGWSIEKTLYDIVEKIYTGWNKNQVASLLILDISGAYDHVCKIRLFHNLRKRQINLKVIGLIEFFLSDRTTTMKTNEYILDHRSI